jgi:uncharacterized membrane protein HdeD (DUF308 family)
MRQWQIQIALAGMVAALGLFVLLNPTSIASFAASVLPWALMGAGAIFLLSIVFRTRRRLMTLIVPGVVGSMLVYLGASIKFGGSVGPSALLFLLALLFFGAGAAKLFMAQDMRQSRYLWLVLGPAAFSLLAGIWFLFRWPDIGGAQFAAALGLELLSDALAMTALALRDRDGEAALETARQVEQRQAVRAAADTPPDASPPTAANDPVPTSSPPAPPPA